MKNIFSLVNCCNRNEVQKSELDVPSNNNLEKINNKIKENEKISTIKNTEYSNNKTTESNIIETNSKNEQLKKDKANSDNNSNNDNANKKYNRRKKKSKTKRESMSIIHKDLIVKKNELMIEEKNKVEEKKKRKISCSKKDDNEPLMHRDSILTLNDLVLNIKTQEEKSENGSKLLLSGELFFYKEIIIQTTGLKDSLRNEKDNHVYFGVKNKKNYSSCQIYNDIFINFFYQNEELESMDDTGRVFEIHYNRKTKDYSLTFYNSSLILYYKINNFLYFNSGKEYYLLLGNILVTINVVKNISIEKSIIIQIELDNNNTRNYSFNQNQTPIKIGRSNNNDIQINNQSISKRHGIIDYSTNIQSFYYRDLGSTNSSILFLKEGDNLKIRGIMNFKLEDVPFKIQEIP
jgi:hypothetical protein